MYCAIRNLLLFIAFAANESFAFSPSLVQTNYIQSERTQVRRESSVVGQTSTQLFIASDVVANGEAAKVKKSREVSGMWLCNDISILYFDSNKNIFFV
jgi:hypothetical protein